MEHSKNATKTRLHSKVFPRNMDILCLTCKSMGDNSVILIMVLEIPEVDSLFLVLLKLYDS